MRRINVILNGILKQSCQIFWREICQNLMWLNTANFIQQMFRKYFFDSVCCICLFNNSESIRISIKIQLGNNVTVFWKCAKISINMSHHFMIFIRIINQFKQKRIKTLAKEKKTCILFLNSLTYFTLFILLKKLARLKRIYCSSNPYKWILKGIEYHQV